MKKIKIALSFALCTACLLTALPVSAAIESTPTSTQALIQASSATIRANVYEWHYKTINGEYYKRKYNVTWGKWEGDWIKV